MKDAVTVEARISSESRKWKNELTRRAGISSAGGIWNRALAFC